MQGLEGPTAGEGTSSLENWMTLQQLPPRGGDRAESGPAIVDECTHLSASIYYVHGMVTHQLMRVERERAKIPRDIPTLFHTCHIFGGTSLWLICVCSACLTKHL